MVPIELQQRGMEILVRELGYADAIRFMLQLSKGRGDYTKQRKRLLRGIGLEELLKASEARVKATSKRRSA